MGKRDKSRQVLTSKAVKGQDTPDLEEEVGVTTFSQSKIKAWRKCRAYYDYLVNQNLEPRKPPRPFLFGTIVHEVLEKGKAGMLDVLQNYADEMGELFIEEQEYYGDILNDIHDIMTEYFIRYGKDEYEIYRADKIDFVEMQIVVPIGQGVIFKGRIDKVVTKKNRRYLVEHKTFKRLPDENHRWRDIQTAIYSTALANYGHPIDGILWNYICSKPPTMPKLNKDGSISNRPIVTLPTTVRRFAKNSGIKVPEKLMDQAQESIDRYFHRFLYPSNPRVNSLVLRDFLDTANEIKEFSHDSTTMTIAQHCSFCQYEPICRAKLGGLDETFIIKKQFKVGDRFADQTAKVDDSED